MLLLHLNVLSRKSRKRGCTEDPHDLPTFAVSTSFARPPCFRGNLRSLQHVSIRTCVHTDDQMGG